MHILQIVHGFPPEAWAGTELVTLHLAQALQERGHRVTVLTRTEDRAADEFSMREEQYGDVAVWRVVNNHTRTTTFRLFYDNPFYDELFRRLLGRVRPDIVHFQHIAHFSASLIALAAAQGYPTVLSLHDFFFPCHRIHLIDAAEKLCAGPERGERCVPCLKGIASREDVDHRFVTMEQAMRAAQRIITPSSFLSEKMAGYFPTLRSKLCTLPLGITPVAIFPRSQPEGQRLRLLYSGLLFPPKGAHLLVDALTHLPADTVEVSLYGAVLPYWQPYVDQLRGQAAGLPVHFRGPYRHEHFPEILAAHDVLVMPMICEETFSLVVREALAAGLPVVAARRGALPAVIEDGVNGLLFEPEDATDLRRCLLRLLNEPGLLERLRSAKPQFKMMSAYAAEMEQIYTALADRYPEAMVRGHAEMLRSGDTEAFPSDSPQLPRHEVSPDRGRMPYRQGTQWPDGRVVSVLIPTKNGERYLDELLSAVASQQGDVRPLEIIAVDSGSRDRTLSILLRHQVRILQIPPEEFGHGSTRNLLASHARGEFLVFLTQDATPVNEHWLHHLIAPLRADAQVAGGYSRQLPRGNCHPMEWRRIVEEELHGQADSRIHSAREHAEDYERNPWLYRFFANTSSVLRRSVWEQIPFPDIAFAEDQAWADQVMHAGYKTAYAAESVVYHSHGYGPWVNFCRHFEHAVAMRQLFAHYSNRRFKECIPEAVAVAKRDLVFWRRQTSRSKVQVVSRWALPAVSWHVAANLGTWLGERADRLPPRVARWFSLQEQVKRR